MALAGEVVGRHLRQAQRQRADGRRLAGAGDDVARLDEGVVSAAAGLHQRARMGAELVDVELVVGEQHEVLEEMRAGRRVVRQPVQRIVDALGGEGGERHRLAGRHLEGAVDDVVVGAGQVRHVEQVAQRPLDARGHRRLDIAAFEEGEMQRDRRLRLAHGHRHAVVADQEAQLLGQVAVEQIGPGDGGGVAAGLGHVAIGEARVDLREGGRRHRDFRVEGAIAPLPVAALGQRLAGQSLERAAQEGGVARIERLQRRHRLAGVGKALARERLGRRDRLGGVVADSFFHGPS